MIVHNKDKGVYEAWVEDRETHEPKCVAWVDERVIVETGVNPLTWFLSKMAEQLKLQKGR